MSQATDLERILKSYNNLFSQQIQLHENQAHRDFIALYDEIMPQIQNVYLDKGWSFPETGSEDPLRTYLNKRMGKRQAGTFLKRIISHYSTLQELKEGYENIITSPYLQLQQFANFERSLPRNIGHVNLAYMEMLLYDIGAIVDMPFLTASLTGEKQNLVIKLCTEQKGNLAAPFGVVVYNINSYKHRDCY